MKYFIKGSPSGIKVNKILCRCCCCCCLLGEIKCV